MSIAIMHSQIDRRARNFPCEFARLQTVAGVVSMLPSCTASLQACVQTTTCPVPLLMMLLLLLLLVVTPRAYSL